MKKLLLFAVCLSFYCSYAQLPPNSFAEDFTLTDINGNEFNLHTTLDEGKTVVLDLFATWCGPCWNFAETGMLEELQNTYPDNVVCVAVEADPSTPYDILFEASTDDAATEDAYESSIGDWTTVVSYLMMDDPSGSVANDYNLNYYPTIYKICPDRMVTELGWLNSVDEYVAGINACTSPQYSKDAKILSYSGDLSCDCDGFLESTSVTIQNYNNNGDALTACSIITKVNGSEVDTYDWSGSLSLYQTATINLGSLSDIPDNATISFELEYAGDMDASNNSLEPAIEFTTESSNYVQLSILTDFWPEETTWDLVAPWGAIAYSGSCADQYTEYVENFTLSAGCWTFNVYDAYGDGVQGSLYTNGTAEDGLVQLSDAQGGVLWSGVAYGSQGTAQFEITNPIGLEEMSNYEISIFPNPFKQHTNLAVYSSNAEKMNIEIYNNLGKVVYNHDVMLGIGMNNIKIESSDLLPGLYYMNVMINGENNLKPLTIIK